MDKDETRILIIALAIQISKLLDSANNTAYPMDLVIKKAKRLNELVEQLRGELDEVRN